VLSGVFFDPPSLDPLWWSAGSPPAINPAAEPNNHGVANIGQAKWMAKNALAALREQLPDVAEEVEAELVGADKAIRSWDAPVTPEEQTKQRSPLLIGQLKAISAPFYNHLHDGQPVWLSQELIANGTSHAGTHLPWSETTTDDNNKGVATIGQLKAVFSLRFESIEISNLDDTDNDGMSDAWELLHFGDLLRDGTDDYDNDGVMDLEEFESGSDPADSSSNSRALQFIVHTRLE